MIDQLVLIVVLIFYLNVSLCDVFKFLFFYILFFILGTHSGEQSNVKNQEESLIEKVCNSILI